MVDCISYDVFESMYHQNNQSISVQIFSRNKKSAGKQNVKVKTSLNRNGMENNINKNLYKKKISSIDISIGNVYLKV